MNRNTIAIVVGVIFGGLFVALGERMGMMFFPTDKPMPTDPNLWVEYLENDVPLMAKLFVILNWGLASFVSSVITSIITKRITVKPVLATTGILNAFAFITMLMLPHPTWMWIASLFAFLPIGLLAYFLIRKKQPVEQ
jgi:hypothetical protein